MEEVAEIERLEDARYAAMLAKDVATLDRLLHPDLVYRHSSGVTDTKASYLEGVGGGVWDYRRLDRSEQTVRREGATAVVFNRFSMSIVIRGVPKEADNRALAVWVQGPAGWQLLALHSAAVGP